MSFFQYLKDTRSELHHVAWPTRVQTIVYTTLVIAISIFVALYLGLFDFVFTTGLSRVLPFLPQGTSSISTSTNDIIIGTSTSPASGKTTPKN